MYANIVLVGFMGTGKSTVGRILAARLDLSFLDMDSVIEQRQGRQISEIFAKEGEAFFRSLERQLTIELAAQQGRVIACGGGIVLNADNIRDYSSRSLVVCLRASSQTILDRVRHETHRPLLAVDDKLGRIRSILATRQPLYDAIPHIIDTDGLFAEAVADRVEALYRSGMGG